MATSIDCPVEGFPGRATSLTNICMNFMHRHMEETIVVLKEGPAPHLHCEKCGMFIPQEAMSDGHLGTAMRKMGTEKKRCRIAVTNTQVESGKEFRAQDQVLENMDTFK